ncbi:MAG: hypothetical protein M0P27_07785, partial [Bacteroidales bacterium]|nr:hypothetical protein [Bacteroidales bacterium]
EKVEKPERIVEKFKYNPVESGMSEESVENPSEPVQKSMVQTSGMPREGIAFIPDKEFMLPETTVGDETLHHSIDPRLLILYSEIMKPKFTE